MCSLGTVSVGKRKAKDAQVIWLRRLIMWLDCSLRYGLQGQRECSLCKEMGDASSRH